METILRSDYRPLCLVTLPYQGRQHYMHSFDLSDPVMAPGFEDYLEPVEALCRAAGATTGIAHMTVDEKIIKPGMSQRRPKPHVDGRFIPQLRKWGGGESGRWLHYCNDVGAGDSATRMPVIVVSSVPGCKAWRGVFHGRPAPDGDLSHISDQLVNGEVLPAFHGYLLSPDCVHESMIFDHEVARTFLRIALPVDYLFVCQ